MFDPEFYPCSKAAWEAMNVDCAGKRVLDPSAGSGTLLKFAAAAGASSCEGIEYNEELRILLSSKFPVIGSDWFQANADQISHIDMILMNPPFSNADEHILHAWKIAPEGCEIVSQCNAETVRNEFTRTRRELRNLIETYGDAQVHGQLYKSADRTTDVEIGIIRLFKPITTANADFDGFYYDMEVGNQTDGIVRYNEIQALVNNYTGALRCFDRFAEIGAELNAICKVVNFGSHIGANFKVSSSDGDRDGIITTKDEFARALQKRCWKEVFAKFNLEKYMTRGVLKNVNRFVESRLNYPFTMKNIYRMVEIIIGTSGENMEKAIVEAIDNFTRHTHENRFSVEGWKTNAGHMLSHRFIAPRICEIPFSSTGNTVHIDRHGRNFAEIVDLTKALCYVTGTDFNTLLAVEYASATKDELGQWVKDESRYNMVANLNRFQINTWYEWGFFRFKLFKKGTGHFQFLRIDDWARLNQAYSQAEGNPLPETTWHYKRKAA